MGEDEIIQYFVVNKELGMSPGKIAAQVAHAATVITMDKCLNEEFLTWFYHHEQKKVVLKGKEKDLRRILRDLPYDTVRVIDKGHTEIPEGSLTVVGIRPMRRSKVGPHIKRLQLL